MRVPRREELVFDPKEQGLREDVHMLGCLVGELVAEQAGDFLFRLAESARRAAIERREQVEGAEARLFGLIDAMPPDNARELVRAFSTYFQMVNVAEKVHRIRRRREYQNDPDSRQPNGFEDTLLRLKQRGLSLEDVQAELARMRLEPIFSPHPIEPVRRTLLRKEQSIVRRMVQLLDPGLTEGQRRSLHARIRLEMTSGWQTEDHPHERMSVADEMEYVLFFLTDVLYPMIPAFYEGLEHTLGEIYGAPERVAVPSFIRFATWVGGDLKGNPETSAKTIRAALLRQRHLILKLYHRECGEIAETLTQSTSRVSVSSELEERIAQYAGHFPNVLHETPARHRDMPYRVFLGLIRERLGATAQESAFPYESAEELGDDVRLLADSLEAHKGVHAGLFLVRRLIRRIEAFGLHAATLDVRQDARVQRAVVAEALGEPAWEQLSREHRTERLLDALEERELPREPLSPQARKVLAVFQSIGFCRRKYGGAAIGPYILDMTGGADDVLSVLLLARWGELVRKSGAVPIDIAPVFETEQDLAEAPRIMQELLALPVYRRHLARRDGRQMVMVDFADDQRDAGVAAVRWMIYRCQQALAEVPLGTGVELEFMHGRGGTVSRGGGKTHATVRTAAPGVIRSRLRASEPGELINAKYGLRAIAVRTLEQVWSALLQNAAGWSQGFPLDENWQEIMGTFAASSRERYQRLVYGDTRFADYFRAATPADVIVRMRIGSQPPSDAPPATLQELPTIPWMFAWSQARFLLPGWFGVGSGLVAAAKRHGEEPLRLMARQWPFLAVLLADAERALAKADMDIARRYSELAGDLHDRFFPIIRQEYALTREWVLRLKQQDRLLDGENTLRRAIRLRNPYVDPMSFLQVDLLRRWRAASREDDVLFRALVASVIGITHGLQNLG